MQRKISTIAGFAALAIWVSPASAVTLNFTVNDETDNGVFPGAAFTDPFGSFQGATDPDFRIMINGVPSGNGEMQISPGVSWTFNDVSGEMTSVSGTDMTSGASTNLYGVPSAAPAGDTGLFKNAPYLFQPYGFLAPIAGSAAANTYGSATITGDTSGNGSFTIGFPVLEGQWGGAADMLGQSTGGISLACSATAGIFNCQGEELLSAIDEGFGLAGQTFQWDLTGAMVATAVPVPAAVWLFGSGLLGLIGISRRKKA